MKTEQSTIGFALAGLTLALAIMYEVIMFAGEKILDLVVML